MEKRRLVYYFLTTCRSEDQMLTSPPSIFCICKQRDVQTKQLLESTMSRILKASTKCKDCFVVLVGDDKGFPPELFNLQSTLVRKRFVEHLGDDGNGRKTEFNNNITFSLCSTLDEAANAICRCAFLSNPLVIDKLNQYHKDLLLEEDPTGPQILHHILLQMPSLNAHEVGLLEDAFGNTQQLVSCTLHDLLDLSLSRQTAECIFSLLSL
eukprot:m.83233 g.83233  ORF g.83233 m.83233 type:complete len:210 (-) comp12117_c0_seq2:676-1305(-)